MFDRNAPPLNPLPPVVWALALPIIAMELVVQAGATGLVGGPAAIGWRLEAMQRFAFSPDLFRFLAARGDWPLEETMRLVTYPFVHGDFMGALFALVILLALGKMVAEVFAWWAVAVIFLASAAGAALIYTALPFTHQPLVGAFPADYGLIGAFTFLLWVRLAGSGGPQGQAFTMIGFLMGVQIAFAALFGGGFTWVADLAGFAVGFALSFLVSPGGWDRVRARLRSR